jgi:transcriptional antiterminator RfaH
MPILKQEADLHPNDLFEQDPPQVVESTQWWAMYTRSRREKDLMRRLAQKDIAFYCPIVEKRHRSPSGRLRTSYMPLFSNYVFLCGSSTDRYEAMCTGCVSRDLEVKDPAALFRDLREIYELIRSGVEVTPEPEIPVGTAVRVTSGPLEGREGLVIDRRGRHRLLVTVNFLQQGASAELSDCDVEPL